MAEQIMHRFESQTMANIVAQEGISRNGLLLRLAWQAGLSRQELQGLTWQQVDFAQGRLQLPQRCIPLEGDLFVALEQWHRLCEDEHWVLSGRSGALPLTSISRLAQHTMQRHGLEGVRLSDLRHHYIITQLQHRSWGAICQELAMDEGALRKAYGAYGSPPREKAQLNTPVFTNLLNTSPPTLGLLAVGLAWYMEWAPSVLRTLTWQQLSTGLPPALTPLVTQLRPKSRRRLVFDGISSAGLSRLARQTLAPHGLEGITLHALSKHKQTQSHRQTVERHLRQAQSLTAHQAQSLLDLPKSATYRLLQGWVSEGFLVQVGVHYYHGAIVPPVADHIALVLAQAQRKRVLYVVDVANLLHIRHNQCQQLLQSLAKSGQLLAAGSRYELP